MKRLPILLGIVLLLVGVGAFFYVRGKSSSVPQTTSIGSPTGKKLVYTVHWAEKFQTDGIYEGDVLKSKGLRQYLEEYTKLHPDISFDLNIIPYREYADKLSVLYDAGSAPDIYQIYTQWGVNYVKKGMLAKPPEDIIADVKKNYVSTSGVTISGDIWGIPTEINDYVLLYNKKLFAEAGVTKPPKTWKEFVDTATKLTKKDSNGKITRYGVAFLKGQDWQVVDPFLSLLSSAGGRFLSADNKQALVNSAAGVRALEAELELFKKGATDIDGAFFDFAKGKVAMVISPPWTKGIFSSEKDGFGKEFEKTVGVVPLPILGKPATLQYTWFMGVMESSTYKQEAWDFLKWFTSEVQPETGTTRYGDLLANTIGAIPSRKVDVEKHAALKDFFTSVYVSQLPNAVAEPNVAESSKIKKILLGEIEAAWSGQKTAKQALDAAATQINAVLAVL